MKSICLTAAGIVCGVLCVANVSHAELTGWWRFEEGAGATAGNSVGGGVDGQISNHETGGLGTDGSVWVTDPSRGSVISFNGAAADAELQDPGGAYVLAGEVPVMTAEQDFTWAFWANNMEATLPNNIVVGNRRDASGADFVPRQFIKFTPTKFEFHADGNGDDNLDYEDMPVDQWLHHAVVKDGTSLTYYLNGQESASSVLTQTLDVAMPLFFGGDNTGAGGENWAGLLDDVRTYDHALSAEEVAALVPEPSAACLLLAGCACLLGAARRKN